MGFSNIWELLEPPAKITKQTLVDHGGPWRSGRTHLLIDYNNLVVSNSGGNYFLTKKFSEYYWAAIKASGFSTKILKDSYKHDSMRGNIILSRRLGSSVSKQNSGSSSTLRKIARSRNVKPTVCKGEADVEIRRLCRELTANGDDVIVLSNDASLIVGIPDSVYVANASKLSLVHNATAAGGGVEYHLEGPILTVASLLKLLDQRMGALKLLSDANRPVRLGPATAGALCLIAALLGGEQERDSIEKAGNPFTMVKYIGSYLFGEKEEIGGNVVFRPLEPNQRHRILSKMGVLLSATALVLSWRLYAAADRNLYDDFDVAMQWPPGPESLLCENIIRECVTKTLYAAVNGHALFSLIRPPNCKKFFPCEVLDPSKLVQLLSLRVRNSLESMPWGSDGSGSCHGIVVYKCSRAMALNLDTDMLTAEQLSVLDVRFELWMSPIFSLVTQVSKLIPFYSLSPSYDVTALTAAISGLRSIASSSTSEEGGAYSSYRNASGFNRWLSVDVFPTTDVDSDDSSDDEDEYQDGGHRNQKSVVVDHKTVLHWRSYPVKAKYWPVHVLQEFKLHTAHTIAVDIAHSDGGKYIPPRGRLEDKNRNSILWRVKKSDRDFGDLLCLVSYPWATDIPPSSTTSIGGDGISSGIWSPLQYLPNRAALLATLKPFSVTTTTTYLSTTMGNAKLPSATSPTSIADKERSSLLLTMEVFKTLIHRSEADIHTAVEVVKRWWSDALKVSLYTDHCKAFFAENMDSSAVTMLTLVQTLVSMLRVDCGFFGSIDGAQYTALVSSFVPKLLEACLLSPLFALAGEHLFYEGGASRVITENGKFDKWMLKLERDLKAASGSVGAHPVGSPGDYLLTALSDKIMKSLLKLSHSRNYASIAAWFDAQAISLSLRIHNIDRTTKSGVPLNRVLNCEAIGKAFLRLDLATTPAEGDQLAASVRSLQVDLDQHVLPLLVGLIDSPQRAADYDYTRYFESFIEKSNTDSDFQNPSGSSSKLKGGEGYLGTATGVALSEPPPLPTPPPLHEPSIVFDIKDSWDDFSPNSPIN